MRLLFCNKKNPWKITRGGKESIFYIENNAAARIATSITIQALIVAQFSVLWAVVATATIDASKKTKSATASCIIFSFFVSNDNFSFVDFYDDADFVDG